MVVEVATTCLQWSQPIVPHSPSSSYQALASVVSSPSRRRRSHRADGGALVCRYVQRLDRSALCGTGLTNLHRTRSCEYQKPKFRALKRACSASASASFDAFSDEEFSKKIQELALRFQLSDYESTSLDSESEIVPDEIIDSSSVNFLENQSPPWPEIPPDWVGRDEIIPASIERKANSVDLPLSLRIIKRKMQWQEGFRDVGESAYSSVKKAFSSMVFIIRELHSYTLQMREFLFYEDLQEIIVRVQKEMHASFVWLFQQVFSHTPTLMMYVMILLANFTVHSMGHNAAIAASLPQVGSQMESMVEIQDQKFDSSTIKTFSASSSSGKMTSIGGNSGGGGKVRPIASGTDGDGGFDVSNQYRTILPDGSSSSSSSQLSSYGTTREAAESETREEEANLWNSVVEEASEMQSSLRHEALDQETMQRFVSPVIARIEADNDYADYFKTGLLYQVGLAQDPNNPLLLANYAQFLYVVAHDYDRAEEYFKKAVGVEPRDAEAYNKYATFLWRVKNDLWAAEETFQQAIDADPNNSSYAANYAHFLWNTGAEDTCFPLGSLDNNTQED
ncbi:uncharacterized protein LOC111985897 [Quercus suber]|uniref:Tetratricopeptide repeat-like superfamily protein n=1 Tax=Quercus suber TaxID=58331 RepID=A0AAW0LHV6_QUESU|nr:uncharacterized protein LOC111985897 [Quercus suber]POE84760.1 hypothetical protein CFP56_61773 [Quercus suber]